MDWRNVLLILFGSSFGIGQGIFSCILEILFDIGDYFLLAGGFALGILLGILSKNKYLPFASVLSAFVTFQVMIYHYLGGDYGIEPSWLLPLLAVIYGLPWIFLRSATRKNLNTTYDNATIENVFSKRKKHVLTFWMGDPTQ